MPTIHSLHISITEMPRSDAFNLIEKSRERRKVSTKTVEQKVKLTKAKQPKTNDINIIAKSLTSAEKEKLKQALLELMNNGK